MKALGRWIMKKVFGPFFPHFLVLAVIAMAPRAEAQGCFGPGCGGGVTTTASVVGNALSCSDAGGDDTYVCTLDPAITSMTNLTFSMKVATGNTGAATVDVNGLGAKSIKKAQGGVTTDPATNDIRAGAVVLLAYDGTNFQLQSTLGNAGAGTGDALVANPLSQFAATTSAQFSGVISDETGAGAVVLATTPTLVTPVIGAATGTSVNLSGGATVGAGVNYCADAGASDAYACSISPAPTSYSTGTVYTFKANTANTGAATLNLNALGAKTIVKTAGGITTALSDNDIRSGSVVQVAYDGTNLQLVSPLANAAGGGTITGTDTHVTFFDGANNPAGDAGFTYNKTTDVATVAGAFRGPAGSASAPTFSFTTGTNYGWWLNGGTQVVLAIAGANRAIFDAGSFQFGLPIEPVGTLGTSVGRSAVRWTELFLGQTITAGGTTGAQTINRATGTVNFAAAATSLVVTNSLVTTSSIIFTAIRTADTTCTFVKSTVPAAGSFTITLNAGCAAETSVGFLVLN